MAPLRLPARAGLVVLALLCAGLAAAQPVTKGPPAISHNSTQPGGAAKPTAAPAAQLPAPRTALPQPSASPAAVPTSLPTQQEQQASLDDAADAFDEASDGLSDADWAALEWAEANVTSNGTTGGDSQDDEQGSADWRFIWLVVGVALGAAAGVGVMVGGCHGASCCDGSCSSQDCRCSGNGLGACGGGGGGEGILGLCLGLLVFIVIAVLATLAFCVGFAVGFALISALGLLCPITRECQRRKEEFLAPAPQHDSYSAARRAAAAMAAGVQLPSAKGTLSSDAGKPFGGASSQEDEAPAVGAPMPSPVALRLEAPLPADMV